MGFTDQTALISSLFERVDAFVVVLDSRGRIVRFNATFEEACGFSPEEIKGKNFCEQFLSSDVAARIILCMPDCDHIQTPQKFEAVCTFADGAQKKIFWWTSPLFNRELSLEYIILTGALADE